AAAERASRSEGGRGSVTAYGATGQGSESAQVLANRLGPIAPRGEIGGGEIRKGRGVCCNARLGSIHTSSRAWRELPRVGPIDEARPDCTKRREKRGFDGSGTRLDHHSLVAESDLPLSRDGRELDLRNHPVGQRQRVDARG